MKKRLLTLLLLCCTAAFSVACGTKEVKVEENEVNVNEDEMIEEINEVSYIIDNEDISIVDYTSLDFVKTEPKEVTEESLNSYIDYLIENYSAETGIKIDEENPLTKEIIKSMTNDAASTEEEFRELSRTSLIKYYEQNAYYEDLNVIYEIVTSQSKLNKWDEEELAASKIAEEEYLNDMAKQSNMEFEEYKKEVLGLETEEDYKKYLEEAALETLKSDKVIITIFENEGIVISDEELETYIENSISYYGYESREAFFELYTEEQLKLDIMYDKVLDFIYKLY